eukprot:m.62946 g.62946  ORF g.62946 m.62946 type:complete len:420 (+) comp11546_c0_seq2:85-1344(+)
MQSSGAVWKWSLGTARQGSLDVGKDNDGWEFAGDVANEQPGKSGVMSRKKDGSIRYTRTDDDGSTEYVLLDGCGNKNYMVYKDDILKFNKAYKQTNFKHKRVVDEATKTAEEARAKVEMNPPGPIQSTTNADTSDPPAAASRVHTRSFATSNYKVEYENNMAPKWSHELLAAIEKFLGAYASTLGLDNANVDQFFESLQAEAFKHKEELIGEEDVHHAAVRFWTSAKIFPGYGKELCFCLNEAIRRDELNLMQPLSVIARSINKVCVTRTSEPASSFPPDACVYRGAVIPKEHIPFFSVGKKYRVPGFLATSFQKRVALRFCQNSWRGNEGKSPAVLWEVQVDPMGKHDSSKICKQACYIERTNVPDEAEYLFAPYSVFTVKRIILSEKPDYKNPHIIQLEAAEDNMLEPEDLPLAPWS